MEMGVAVKVLCVFVLLLHNSIQQVFNDRVNLILPADYNIGWMRTLDDNKLISSISIPGTHASLAVHGGPEAECQSWSLESQLKAGIRYLELSVSGRDLKVVHGLFSQHTTFVKVLDTLKKFLSVYTSEAVVVQVKHVSKDRFPVRVLNQLKNDPDCWVSNKVPQIKEVRGKIVFVQKNDFKLGISLIETDEEDDYKVSHIGVKEAKITRHLNEALKDCKADIAVLSYSSGTGWPVLRLDYTPKAVAKKINPWLYDYLGGIFSPTSKRCFGILAMDFPGFALIQRIIGFNH
ncbi:1-phosphatidylinositol phosphodiesterase-like [Danio aesculapii]|uniref:1-phosphatidylinositol phosphodiesterase-like n=1 Tax=Danio aesculapii TaxID=1142201 RepID=UPI0024BF71EB|nr:1-phosphatidylinositol phosphodiesterase-like [Danio aesculapii]